MWIRLATDKDQRRDDDVHYIHIQFVRRTIYLHAKFSWSWNCTLPRYVLVVAFVERHGCQKRWNLSHLFVKASVLYANICVHHYLVDHWVGNTGCRFRVLTCSDGSRTLFGRERGGSSIPRHCLCTASGYAVTVGTMKFGGGGDFSLLAPALVSATDTKDCACVCSACISAWNKNQ